MKRFIRACGIPTRPAAAVADAPAHTTDSLADVKRAMAYGDAVLIDVREAAEWAAGHLRIARHLPLSELAAGTSADRPGRAIPPRSVVYLHCAAGGRCRTAADLLRRQGYDARPLKDGYESLLRAGFERAEQGDVRA